MNGQAAVWRSDEDRLITHGLLLGAVMGVANVANVLFHGAMGRMLSTAEYGVLMSMYGILYLIVVPAEALRTTTAYYSASDSGNLSMGAVFSVAFRRLAAVTAAALAVLLAASPWLAGFFRLEGPGPVMATACVGAATLLMTTLHGLLQGRQRFGAYGLSVNIWFFGRLGAAMLLVALGWRSTGALLGMMAGALVAALVPAVLLRSWFRDLPPAAEAQAPGLFRYAAQALLIFGGFMLLGNIDVIAAKHYYSPDRAGDFSQAALLGHFLWLVPIPLVMAMFPKAVRQHRAGARRLLLRTLLLTVVLACATMIFLLFGRSFVFLALFDAPRHALLPLLPYFLGAHLPLAGVYVLMNYALAVRAGAMLPLLLAAVAADLAAVVWFHHHVAAMLLALGVCHGLLLLAAALFTWKEKGR